MLVGISEIIRLILIKYVIGITIPFIKFIIKLLLVTFINIFNSSQRHQSKDDIGLLGFYPTNNKSVKASEQNSLAESSSSQCNKASSSENLAIKGSNPDDEFEDDSPHDDSILHSQAFDEWLAGVIDGDGTFTMSKKGYVTLEITMDIRDKKALYDIKHKFGGSVKLRSNAKAMRYRLHNKKGFLKLIEAINGQLRNPIRILQFSKLCKKYNIELRTTSNLTFNNGWLAGIIDSDGSISYNEASDQIFISITQKNNYILEPLIKIYGGRINLSNAEGIAFKYVIYRKNEILNLVDNYFTKYPLRSAKNNRCLLIKELYKNKKFRHDVTNDDYKKWLNIKNKWQTYSK